MSLSSIRRRHGGALAIGVVVCVGAMTAQAQTPTAPAPDSTDSTDNPTSDGSSGSYPAARALLAPFFNPPAAAPEPEAPAAAEPAPAPAAPPPPVPAAPAPAIPAAQTQLQAPPAPVPAPAPEPTPVSLPAPPAPSPPSPPAGQVLLDKPTVLDTARLQSGAITVTLFGIDGQSGEPAQGLQGFISAATAPITCQAQPDGSSVCLMPDGNGHRRGSPDQRGRPRPSRCAKGLSGPAARSADRPARHLVEPAAAPPEEVRHPSVPNTATLVAAGKTYRIDGIEGFAAPYAGQMQSYIAANGDVLSCNAQATPGTYTCLLRDGTDLAKIALVNGAARVSADAPDAYRLQQGDALANKRGFWSTPQGSALIATLTTAPPPAPDYPLLAGDDGGDGISYVGGQPTALIDGSVVFLTFVGLAGWGYYDAFHHWHDAPGRYREHLDRYHPNGEGLRGYDHGVRGPAMALNRPGNIGVNHPAGFGGRPEGPVGRPGGPVPQVSHAGPAAPMPGRPAPAAARPMAARLRVAGPAASSHHHAHRHHRPGSSDPPRRRQASTRQLLLPRPTRHRQPPRKSQSSSPPPDQSVTEPGAAVFIIFPVIGIKNTPTSFFE